MMRDIQPISVEGPQLPWSLAISVAGLMAAVERMCEVVDTEHLDDIAPLLAVCESLSSILSDLESASVEDAHRLIEEALVTVHAISPQVLEVLSHDGTMQLAAEEICGCAQAVSSSLEAVKREAAHRSLVSSAAQARAQTAAR